ncbi:tetratricopeptide repeat protein [Streptomyces sp. NBC_01231]|nr:tetratricopeptide repeat protein [Streptomyces sp. NBC_01231]
MSRLSRDKKRDRQGDHQRDHQAGHQRAERPAASAAPIEVRVPGDAGPGCASIGGVRVVAAPGQEVQQAVLNHLHRLALATGRTVLATIHDTRIGYVVPLRVTPEGASDFSSEPVRMDSAGERGERDRRNDSGEPEESEELAAPGTSAVAPGVPGGGVEGAGVSATSGAATSGAATSGAAAPLRSPVWPEAPAPEDSDWPAPASDVPTPPLPSGPPVVPVQPQWAQYDRPTHLPREVAEPVRDEAPTFRMRTVSSDAVPERAVPGDAMPEGAVPDQTTPDGTTPDGTAPDGTAPDGTAPDGTAPDGTAPDGTAPDGTAPDDEAAPTFTLRALPQPQPPQTSAPGTVAAPTGVFGPPPVMDTPSAPAPERGPMSSPGRAPERPPVAAPAPASAPAPLPTPLPTPASLPTPAPLLAPKPSDDLGLDPAPKPTPPRGFDAVAEAVLGDGPLTAPGDDAEPALLAEPMGRINEEVKAGRTDAAAELAERTVAQASETLGPEHPEVLRLRELTAYIAYLAGEPVRAFRLSLDLAHVHHRARDAEAAYANVQSAFTAWRAVRDPREGLDLGQALIALWTELTSEEGPAADDIEQLEKANARMGRLTDRARDSD